MYSEFTKIQLTINITSIETYEFPSVLLEARKVDSNWILEWSLESEYDVELVFYIGLVDSTGGKLE